MTTLLFFANSLAKKSNFRFGDVDAGYDSPPFGKGNRSLRPAAADLENVFSGHRANQLQFVFIRAANAIEDIDWNWTTFLKFSSIHFPPMLGLF